MNKKFISVIMAAILAVSSAAVCASATEVEVEKSGDTTGKIRFNMGDWNHDDFICFYIWAKNGDETRHLSKEGWESDDNWGRKKLYGTPVEGEDGIVESYDIEFWDGWDYYVIFHDVTTGAQTYDCVFNANAIGQTAYMTGNTIENPVDSEKTAIEADFDGVDGCGAYLQITSTGNIVGHASASQDDGTTIVAKYVFDKMGTKDKSGEECCTEDKVANAISTFGTTADNVWAKFQELDGHEDKDAEAKKLIKPTEDTTSDTSSADNTSSSSNTSSNSSTSSTGSTGSTRSTGSTGSSKTASGTTGGSTSSAATSSTASATDTAATGDARGVAAFATVLLGAAAAVIATRKKIEE